jgi:hypothetical protein
MPFFNEPVATFISPERETRKCLPIGGERRKPERGKKEIYRIRGERDKRGTRKRLLLIHGSFPEVEDCVRFLRR